MICGKRSLRHSEDCNQIQLVADHATSADI